MIIRPAHALDVPLLVTCWQDIDRAAAIRPFGGDSADKTAHAEKVLQHAIESAHAVVLVATDDNGEIVGTIAGHVFNKPGVVISSVGVIYSAWVDAERRRQGIGQQLLDHIERALENKGAKAFQVGWDTSNTTAEAWWQQRGYAPYEVIASKVIK